jgi:hypothetical protein
MMGKEGYLGTIRDVGVVTEIGNEGGSIAHFEAWGTGHLGDERQVLR